MPTFIAFLAMVLVIGAVVVLAGATTFSVFVGALLAAGGLVMGIKGWDDSAMPKSLVGWISTGAICLGVGAAVYTVECIVGKLVHPDLNFLEAGLRTGPFGGVCTVVVTGWLVLFAIGGAAYRGTKRRIQARAGEAEN